MVIRPKFILNAQSPISAIDSGVLIHTCGIWCAMLILLKEECMFSTKRFPSEAFSRFLMGKRSRVCGGPALFLTFRSELQRSRLLLCSLEFDIERQNEVMI